MEVDTYVNKIIDNYNLRDYTVDYIIVCEEASLDECIDFSKFDNPNEDTVNELVSTKKFLADNETEIKSRLLKYQQDKYGDVGLGSVRVQGM